MPDLSSQRRSPLEHRTHRLQRLRRLSVLLDSAIRIPGTQYRVGLDPLIGLIPGGGDTAGLFFSAFVVLEAAQMGATKSTLSLMAFNILLETLVGTIPGLGDLFDATWKSNLRNLEILEKQFNLAPPVRRVRNHWFAILLILGLIIAFIACAYASFLLLRWIVQNLSHIT